MLRATWKSLMGHKLRLAATAISVVLGVGLVSGAYVLTDAMGDAFDGLFGEIVSGVDVSVRGTQAFGQTPGPGAGVTDQRQPVPTSLFAQIKAIDGVAAADFTVEGYAQLIGSDGEPVGGMGPPTIGVNAPTVPELSTGLEVREGRLPTQPGEIALDAGTAQTQGLEVGDAITVVTTRPAEEQEVVGTVGFGQLDSLMGATLVIFDAETATELFAVDGGYSSVEVAAAPGVDSAALRDRIASVAGAQFEVLTGEGLAQDLAGEVKQGLGFLTTVLLVFAGVALFVGAFLIANTFSIIVAQRTRELALLRAVGASRRQVLGSVLGEATATGLFGAVLGLLFGFAVAAGLTAVMGAIGVDLPRADLTLRPRTVVVSLIVGVGVTVVAAVAPALRATRVAPVAALQAVAAPPPPTSSRMRIIGGGVLAVIGIALLAAGLFADGGIEVVGAGAVVFLLAVAVLSPLAVRPLMRVIGLPARARGAAGELATRNAVRSPSRTASTAAALMIGLALVSFVLILTQSVRATADDVIEQAFRAEFVVGVGDGFTPISPEVADRLEELAEVAVAARQRVGQFRRDGTTQVLGAMPADRIEEVFSIDVIEGSFAAADNGLVVSDDVAEKEGWSTGDSVDVEFALTGEQSLPIVGVFDGQGVDVDFMTGLAMYERHFRDQLDLSVYVRLADGVTVEQARPVLEAAVADFPTARVQDQTDLREQIDQQLNQLLSMIFVLLALSILIALFGIVNTLGLSIYERIRELGLLRAVGMSRRQVRTMVRWEAVLIAVLGAVLGLLVGVVFAWMLTRALADQGITQFAVPGGQLAIAVILAALAGVLAAIVPARRASRIKMLEAISAE
ncbi:MAG TPA: FtsX-like permease family protein [Egibacteraceae bacterium]|nr:FtsX-like permease family protein [Egibacteraceae bacterium]